MHFTFVFSTSLLSIFFRLFEWSHEISKWEILCNRKSTCVIAHKKNSSKSNKSTPKVDFSLHFHGLLHFTRSTRAAISPPRVLLHPSASTHSEFHFFVWLDILSLTTKCNLMSFFRHNWYLYCTKIYGNRCGSTTTTNGSRCHWKMSPMEPEKKTCSQCKKAERFGDDHHYKTRKKKLVHGSGWK